MLHTLNSTYSYSFSYCYYDAWGNRRNSHTWDYDSDRDNFLFDRGYTGHEHLDDFAIINMNGRIYDPLTGRMMAPDNYVQSSLSQNLNRYSYCLNNPMIYTDPSGDFITLAAAIIFGATNLAIQAKNGEINNLGDGVKAFGAGAIAGGVISSAVIFVPILGSVIQGAGLLYGGSTVLSTVSGLGKGAFTGDWSRLENTGKILAGNFYLDGNRNFLGQTWQGISRFSWELPQSTIGHGFSQLRNAFGKVDKVQYFGGATFSINENAGYRDGVSIGNHINITIADEIQGRFNERVITDPLFMHEYGHTFDSQIFGLSYLFAVGIPSLLSAKKSTFDTIAGVSTHDMFWTESRANRHGARYFQKYYGVDWSQFEPPFDSYPRWLNVNKKIMNNLIITILMFFTFIFHGCEKGVIEKKYAIKVNNNTNHKIRFYIASLGSEHIYPDTLLPSKKYVFKEILPQMSGYRDSSVPWAEVFNSLPSDTLSIFIFDSDTLSKYQWETIYNEYKVLKRYDVSLADLELRKFIIEFPYDIDLGKLKVFPE